MNLSTAITATLLSFKRNSRLIHRESWQAVNVSRKPEMATHELVGHSLTADIDSRELQYLKDQIKPDLPWADDHFAERVSGHPYNPPPSEAWWPHAPKGNQQFMTVQGKMFSHTYPERYWPVYDERGATRRGVRYEYGDLSDVLCLLQEEPFTRQAYLPVWFPEDTGNKMKQRTPCSLGYHFLLVNDQSPQLDVFYYIRSCDLVRHFRNDIYLTARLALWMLDRLSLNDADSWDTVPLGRLHMCISSLHCFRNDWMALYGEPHGTHQPA